jgi:hypothetical protein
MTQADMLAFKGPLVEPLAFHTSIGSKPVCFKAPQHDEKRIAAASDSLTHVA